MHHTTTWTLWYSFMKFLLFCYTGLFSLKSVNLCKFTAWCPDVCDVWKDICGRLLCSRRMMITSSCSCRWAASPIWYENFWAKRYGLYAGFYGMFPILSNPGQANTPPEHACLSPWQDVLYVESVYSFKGDLHSYDNLVMLNCTITRFHNIYLKTWKCLFSVQKIGYH